MRLSKTNCFFGHFTMPGRKPNAVKHCITSAFLAFVVLYMVGLVGCAGWRVPRIDPSGRHLFLPQGQIGQNGVAGPPVASTGPTYSSTPPAFPSGPIIPGQTLPAQTPLIGPNAAPTGNQAVPPVWPDSRATSVYPNGYSSPAGAQPAVGVPLIPTQMNNPPGTVIRPIGPPIPAEQLFGATRRKKHPILEHFGFGSEEPVNSGPKPKDRLVLSPKRLLAPIGSEVILKAAICADAGHLLSDQKIEWLLSKEGVGEFTTVGESSWMRPLNKPKKHDNHFATGRTSSKAFVINRGTADPSDDVQVRDGETWISVTSAVEGTSLVTAIAPEVDDWTKRKITAMVHWIDAQWSFPQPVAAASGTPQRLTTRLSRHSDGSPISGWRVRYEMLDKGVGGFAPDGAEVVEATTNEAGEAMVEVIQAGGQPGAARIAMQVIRPPLPGANENIILANGNTTVTWSAPQVSVQTRGPGSAAIGATATYEIVVTNSGDAPARNIIASANPPVNLQFIQSNPASGNRQNEWQIAEIGPHQSQTISVDYKVVQPGEFDFCAQLQTADGRQTQSCTRTRVAAQEEVLEIQMTGPQNAVVGGTASFTIVVVNRGTAVARNIMLVDAFDKGLEHPGDNDHAHEIESDNIGSLQPGQSSEPIDITFSVVSPGQLCHKVIVTSESGASAQKSACLNATGNAGTGGTGTVPELPLANELPAAADIKISKAPPRRAHVGDMVLFKITVTNTGAVDLQSIEVEEAFPVGLTPINATPGNEKRGQTLTWVIDRLPIGQKKEFQIEYRCDAASIDIQGTRTTATAAVGNLVRQAEGKVEILPRELNPGGENPGPVNGAGPLPGPVNTQPGLELSISALRDQVRAGERVTYNVVIINKGQTEDKNVQLKLSYSPELTPDLPQINRLLQTKGMQVGAQGGILTFSTLRGIRAGETISIPLTFDTGRSGTAKVIGQLSSDGLAKAITLQETTELLPR